MLTVEPRRRVVGTVSGTDFGFTLIELLVTMIVASVMMSIGIFSFTRWQNVSQQKGSAEAVVSALRNAAERSVSEGRTYCVDFSSASTRTYVVHRVTCGTGTVAGGGSKTLSAKVLLATTVTSTPCPTGDKCIYFYPRGTASAATVVVSSTARSQLYTVHVEGLTARVYL